MLPDGKNWCVLTTYKENYSLLPAFLAFYHRRYGIGNFLALCGLSASRTHASLKALVSARLRINAPAADSLHQTAQHRPLAVSEFVGDGYRLWVASYSAADFTSEVEFHDLKLELHKWADAFLPPEILRVLAPDNDEFLHVHNPRLLCDLESLGFHFVDVIPSPQWPPAELHFSLQGWYYRRQAQPRFKYGGRLALAVARKLGRVIEHGGCKTFHFDRQRLRDYSVWHHGTDTTLCSCWAVNRHLHHPQRCGQILQETACGYHLAMTSKAHFLSERLRLFSRIQTDLLKKPVEDSGRSAETADETLAGRTFDRFMSRSIFPVFQDNSLLPLLQDTL